MGFIKDKQSESSIYASVTKEQRIVRPLWKRPNSFWQHWIAKVIVERGGKAETLRNSGSEPCTESNACTLCTTPDPLWDNLTPRDKFRRDGSRSDFGRSLRHGLPVWDYANQCVRMLVGGNSLFAGFDEAEDGGIDITGWDWVVWKSEDKGQANYHAIRSNEQGQFNVQGVLPEQIEAITSQFQKNDVNCDTSQNLMLRIGSGNQSQQQATAFGQAAPPQGQIPQQTMGALPAPGQPPMPTSNFVQQPPQQMPQQPVQAPGYIPPQMQQQPVPQPAGVLPQPGQPFGTAPQQQPAPFIPPQPQPTQQPQLPLQAAPEPAPVAQPQAPVPQPPPQPEATGGPGVAQSNMTQEQMDRNIQIPTGKYQQKSLEWVQSNDPNYFKGLGSFLKNYPDIVAARDRLQNGNYPAISPPSAAVIPQQTAPVVMAPPVQNIPAPAPVQAPVPTAASNGNGIDRDKLEAEVNALFMSRSDLWMKSPQGVQAMADFLNTTIGTTAYNQAPAEQLQVLKSALEQHHAGNPNPQ